MYTTYHLTSAQEINSDILDAIKAAFKSKPITITIEEELDTTSYLNSNATNKEMIFKSLEQDKKNQHISIKHKNL